MKLYICIYIKNIYDINAKISKYRNIQRNENFVKYYWRNLTLPIEHLDRQNIPVNTRTKICVSQRFRSDFAMEIREWKGWKWHGATKLDYICDRLLVGYDVLLINDHLYSIFYSLLPMFRIKYSNTLRTCYLIIASRDDKKKI